MKKFKRLATTAVLLSISLVTALSLDLNVSKSAIIAISLVTRLLSADSTSSHYMCYLSSGTTALLTSLEERCSGSSLVSIMMCSYKCNKPGHIARDCEGEASCRNCGQPGHFANECTNPPLCRNCGQSGHIARECPNEAICRKCGKPGHIARECKE